MKTEPLSKVTIRKATLDDVAALVGLLGELFQFEHEFKPDPEAQRKGVEAILQDEKVGIIHVAECDGKVVGMVNLLLTISTALGGPVAWLEDLIVTEKWQGRGVGRLLLKTAFQECTKRACLRIMLTTDHDNLKAKALYKSEGFEQSTMHLLRKML